MRFAHSHASAKAVDVRPVRCACVASCLRDRVGLGAMLGFQEALVPDGGARVARCRAVDRVLAGQHATRDRRVGRDADAVMIAGGQDLDLRHAVQQVVVGLADHGRRHVLARAFVHDLGNAPAVVVGNAEVTDLARADQVADRTDRLGDRRRPVVLVQVVDVDPVRAEPAEAVLAGLHEPAPRQAAVVGARGEHVARLGGQDPLPPVRLDRRADDALGFALDVGVRGVDEVHARIARRCDDLACLVGAGAVAEGHRAEAQRRGLEAGAAEPPIRHLAHGFLR